MNPCFGKCICKLDVSILNRMSELFSVSMFDLALYMCRINYESRYSQLERSHLEEDFSMLTASGRTNRRIGQSWDVLKSLEHLVIIGQTMSCWDVK